MTPQEYNKFLLMRIRAIINALSDAIRKLEAAMVKGDTTAEGLHKRLLVLKRSCITAKEQLEKNEADFNAKKAELPPITKEEIKNVDMRDLIKRLQSE